MTRIVTGIKQAFGKLTDLIYKPQIEILSEEKKKPGYHDLVMAEIASLDPFDHSPRLINKPMHLVWKYENKNNEVVSWLGEIALDDYYKNSDAQDQAFLVLKENNGLDDLINYIRKRLKN